MVDGWYEFRGHGKGDDAESVSALGGSGRGVLNSASKVYFQSRVIDRLTARWMPAVHEDAA